MLGTARTRTINAVRPLQLYHSPGAPSRSAHIALRESGIAFDLVRVVGSQQDQGGRGRLMELSPFGLSPVLEFPDHSTLREAPAIMEYVADHATDASLAPACGTFERARLAEWLHFLAFHVSASSACGRPPTICVSQRRARLAWIDLQLSARPHLLGERYTIADIFFWSLWSWETDDVAFGSTLQNIGRWYVRIAEREPVREALRAEA